MTVSGHPARVTPRRPAGRPRTPTGSSRCRLAQRRRAGDPPPSLPGRYPSSSLLRGGPPLTGTLVLSASRVRRLGLFPWHHRPGSHVLPGSPGWSHVPFTPDATWPVNRLPPGCSQGIPSTLVLASSLGRSSGTLLPNVPFFLARPKRTPEGRWVQNNFPSLDQRWHFLRKSPAVIGDRPKYDKLNKVCRPRVA